ncbi:hypothetical protein CEXT_534811 [Caerostris extrusa]|uniref:Uncharacterized protein n=1 Tax=Caerostris extrusa TaxID=172846 RepID=A0AAV4SGT0_CAEEX|nr:hypothetical protein CEXT_534811 [Caerostris extrusa]
MKLTENNKKRQTSVRKQYPEHKFLSAQIPGDVMKCRQFHSCPSPERKARSCFIKIQKRKKRERGKKKGKNGAAEEEGDLLFDCWAQWKAPK